MFKSYEVQSTQMSDKTFSNDKKLSLMTAIHTKEIQKTDLPFPFPFSSS